MDTIGHLTAATKRALVYGDSDIASYFCLHMDAAARLKFDGHLVRTQHPLAYEAGTCEHRFVTIVKRMAQQQREWLANLKTLAVKANPGLDSWPQRATGTGRRRP